MASHNHNRSGMPLESCLVIVTLGRPCWTEIIRMEDQKR